jgi:hypothetical protein
MGEDSSTLEGEFFLNNFELIVKGKFKAVGSKDSFGIFHIESRTEFIKGDFITGDMAFTSSWNSEESQETW